VAWRLAGSLVVLRDQINAHAPQRSRASDGTIGDAAHASRCSRHNPNDFGVVTALDITHDPARGCDIHAIADHIRRNPHPELSYLISLGRIAGRSTGWAWHRYTGSNPHNIHVHFGVGQGSDCEARPPYDSPAPWNIGLWIPPPEEDWFTMATEADLRRIIAEELRRAKQAPGYFAVTSSNSPTAYYVAADHQSKLRLTRGSDLHNWIKDLHEIGGLSGEPLIVAQSNLDAIPDAQA
jgi:hypothetical protein